MSTIWNWISKQLHLDTSDRQQNNCRCKKVGRFWQCEKFENGGWVLQPMQYDTEQECKDNCCG